MLSFRKAQAIRLLLFIITLFPIILNGQGKMTQEAPNILLIFIDDMGWPAVSALGNEHVQTKNIDRIANEGMLFTDAYVNPQCTPSRASLLTGQHTARNRFWHVIGRYGYPYMRMDEPPYEENLPRNAYTLAEMLQDNGYFTAINGKWHLHTWNDRYPESDGYYTYLFDTASIYYGWDYNTIPEDMHYPSKGEKGVDYLTDEAIRSIEKSGDKPFFIYLSHHTIHGPVLAPEKLIKKYRRKGYPIEGAFNATYLAAIEHLDNSIGRLLDYLDDKNLSENTLVIFLTDNGGVDEDFPNDPIRYGKGSMYEGGIRVPMMVRWPGKVRAGSLCNTPVHAIDIYPTLLEISDGKMQNDWILDGLSIIPLLQETTGFTRDALYWYMPLYDAGWGATPCAIIRKGDYKLIEFFGDYCDRENNWAYIPEGRTELFNLKNDLGEKNNLSKEMPELTEQLKSELYKWIDEMNAPLPILNTRFNPERAWERSNNSLNFRPILEKELPDIKLLKDTDFVFTVDERSFREYDDESLFYTACLEGGEGLPKWIQFDANKLRFSGITGEPTRILIELRAIDPQGAYASDQFIVEIK